MNDAYPFLVIVVLGLGTYAMRVGGHLILSRFARIPPRVEAALEAVPAAVLTAIVAPMAFTQGVAETLAALVTIAAALWLPILPVLVIATASVAGFRSLGL